MPVFAWPSSLSLPHPPPSSGKTPVRKRSSISLPRRRPRTAGNLDLAAQEYLEVTRLLPNVAEAYASLGMVYNAQGKFAESQRRSVKPKS